MTVLSVPENGIVGGYTGDNIHIQRSIIAFTAIALYNACELIFLICLRFKRWQGLYFWSLMITSWAIVIYQIGSFGKMTQLVADPVPMTVFTNVGWLFMIGGNSLVLYSRLHMLTQNRMLLRCVLWGVLINTACMYIPTTILDTGANIINLGEPSYVDGYSIMERVQMSLFTVQESIISAIYLLEAWRFLKVLHLGRKLRGIMNELVAVNIMLILLDIALLTVAQKNLFAVEVTFKGFVYSVKLKLELGVLSRLVKIVTSTTSGVRSATVDNDMTMADANGQAFTGLEFSASPFQERNEEAKAGLDSSNSNSNTSSIERQSVERKPSHAIPWLGSNVKTNSDSGAHERRHRRLHRAMSMQANPFGSRFQRRNARQDSFPISPTTTVPEPPLPVHQKPQLHQTVPEEDELWANTEFLTIEGANDDNIRQFQREIEAELAGEVSARDKHLSHIDPDLEAAEDPPLSPDDCKTETARAFERAEERRKSMRDSMQTSSGASRFRAGSEESTDADWQRKLGVLGAMQSSGLIGPDVGLGSPVTSRKSPVLPPASGGAEKVRSFEDGFRRAGEKV